MSGKEIILNANTFIVSETDEAGLIRYANDEFCDVSEFTLDELIGKPHNIVRHKDMPSAAFEDLWKTIKSGNTWKGFVKNKTKSGNYYWVYSTIYPLTTSDGNKGYLSCRKMASRDEIIEVEELYKSMR